MNEFQYILSIALGQGVILAFFLLTSRYYRSRANTWLALALMLLSVISVIDVLGGEYAARSLLVEFFLHDLELEFLIYVPFYYFFSISTVGVEKGKGFNFYLLLPFVVDTLINIWIAVSIPLENIADHSGIQMFYEIERVLEIAFNFFLSYRSYQLIKTNVRDSERKIWIYKVWQSTFVLLLAWVLITAVGYVLTTGLTIFIIGLYILISVWMFWLLYNGIVNLKLLEDRKNIHQKRQDKVLQRSPEPVKVETQIVSEESQEKVDGDTQIKPNKERFKIHFENIHSLIISESLFRDEDLGIENVAERMQMSSGYISKIIKNAVDKNFPSWINEFRVAEVIEMFGDPDFHNYTTLSIGLEAGFKSKSAFYASFKKITGETPAKFRKKKS